MAFNKAADKDGAPMKRRPMHRRKKSLRFLVEKNNVIELQRYKQIKEIHL